VNRSAERKVVVVTGASAGVGRATVREFAEQGYSVGLIARGTEGLEAAAAEARNKGVRAVAAPADVADPDAVEQAAAKIEREAGPIDVWVNVAMTTVYAPFAEIAPTEYKRATEVTYLGYVYGTMAALRRMRARNYGTIVQVGSALSYRAIPLQSPGRSSSRPMPGGERYGWVAPRSRQSSQTSSCHSFSTVIWRGRVIRRSFHPSRLRKTRRTISSSPSKATSARMAVSIARLLPQQT
jgi:NAD(P)-dependent dehydrogenase (short-subunit alcohol dehydrogenase family)